MRKVIGLAIIALGVFLEILWLGFCFGSILIGILLLIFAPAILFFPFNFFLILGLSIIKGQNYKSFKYQANYRYQNGGSRQNFTPPTSHETLTSYYEVLESKESDSMEVIKANYRRLMKSYHYDTLASQNLSKEMLELAEEKTKALNEAYTHIKKMRKK